MKEVLGRIGRSLGHPLVLLVAGALVTAVLIPNFTRQWQEREKELEIKSALVEEMSEASAEFAQGIKMYAFDGFGTGRSREALELDLSNHRREFDTRQPVVSAKLNAYFPAGKGGDESSLAGQWKSHAHALVSFFDVVGTSDETFRETEFAKLASYLGEKEGIATLLSPNSKYESRKSYREYRSAFLAAEASLDARLDALVQRVIASDSAL